MIGTKARNPPPRRGKRQEAYAILIETKARVGVFAIALGAYLPQFPSLVPEFEAQYADFKTRIPASVELIDGGIVTTKEKAMEAGDKFRAADVDLMILQLLTYATPYIQYGGYPNERHSQRSLPH